MVYEINRDSLANQGSSSFEFNIVAQMPMAHSNDVNCVQFHPVKGDILASCSDDGKIKIWKVSIDPAAGEATATAAPSGGGNGASVGMASDGVFSK